MAKPVVDPVKAREQFQKDLDAMRVGPKDGVQRQQLMQKNFGRADYRSNRWRAELPEHQTLDDALDPSFWTSQADELMRPAHKGRGDIIEIWKPDASQFAELLVVETGKGFVRTVLLRSEKPDDVAAPEASPLSLKWNIGSRSHDVVRKADGVVMRTGFQTKAAAVAWIADHMAKVAA